MPNSDLGFALEAMLLGLVDSDLALQITLLGRSRIPKPTCAWLIPTFTMLAVDFDFGLQVTLLEVDSDLLRLLSQRVLRVCVCVRACVSE